MTTTIEYKGYVGTVSIDEETGFLYASTIGMRGGASAMAETFSQLKAEFAISIDEYLEDCAERGVTPERSFSGEFRLQIEPETHRLALEAARMGNQSLNAFVSEAIREKIDRISSQTQSLEDAPLKAAPTLTSSTRQHQEAAIASPDS
ncbi:MAG: toxin-antitoxin system HicB family antitoxin [Cyanobacteria bacterium P01_F01_bin.33]